MENCIFCNIVNKTAPAELIYEDEMIMVFKDLYPKAKVHLLLIPKLHINSLAELQPEHQAIILHAMYKLPKIANQIGLQNGFKTVVNTGIDGGQVINHLHFHILGPKETIVPKEI